MQGHNSFNKARLSNIRPGCTSQDFSVNALYLKRQLKCGNWQPLVFSPLLCHSGVCKTKSHGVFISCELTSQPVLTSEKIQQPD
ncbi:TPA: hypothetical protein ACPDKO_000136 [Pasteurella multocida]